MPCFIPCMFHALVVSPGLSIKVLVPHPCFIALSHTLHRFYSSWCHQSYFSNLHWVAWLFIPLFVSGQFKVNSIDDGHVYFEIIVLLKPSKCFLA